MQALIYTTNSWDKKSRERYLSLQTFGSAREMQKPLRTIIRYGNTVPQSRIVLSRPSVPRVNINQARSLVIKRKVLRNVAITSLPRGKLLGTDRKLLLRIIMQRRQRIQNAIDSHKRMQDLLLKIEMKKPQIKQQILRKNSNNSLSLDKDSGVKSRYYNIANNSDSILATDVEIDKAIHRIGLAKKQFFEMYRFVYSNPYPKIITFSRASNNIDSFVDILKQKREENSKKQRNK